MHRAYGLHSGTCKDCPHLIGGEYHDRRYYKCRAYGVSRSEATDWRLSWRACGLIDIPDLRPDFRPVLERIKHESKKAAPLPIEGQIKMEV